MRVLLQTIGTGGDGYPVWQALAGVIRERNPDRVVFLCSTMTVQKTMPRVRECLADFAMPAEEVHVQEDVDDVDRLVGEYGEIIDRIRNDHPDARLDADFTSGTKAMSAALVVAASTRGVGRLLYSTGPRDESGRATATTTIRGVSPALISARHQLDRLGLLFNQGQFLAARDGAKQVETELASADAADTPEGKQASTLRFIADAYEKWDRFAWKAAFSCLREYKDLTDRLGNVGWDTDRLGAQVAFLKRAKEADEKKRPADQRLVDLLASAGRCIERGRFDDAVARLYRLIEYIGQARLFAPHMKSITSIRSTKRVPVETLRQIAPSYTDRRPLKDGATKDLGCRDNIEVLAEAGDRVGAWLYERYLRPDGKPGQLKNLLETRNKSLLGHSTEPVGERPARELYDLARAAMEEHLDDTLGDGSARLRELEAAATFLRCPWTPAESQSQARDARDENAPQG